MQLVHILENTELFTDTEQPFVHSLTPVHSPKNPKMAFGEQSPLGTSFFLSLYDLQDQKCDAFGSLYLTSQAALASSYSTLNQPRTLCPLAEQEEE